MLALSIFAVACGGDDDDEGAGDTGAADTGGGGGDVSGEVSVMSTWSGPEQASFEAVIAGFNEQYPNVDVSYDSAGDALPTVLSTAVEGGNPPRSPSLPSRASSRATSSAARSSRSTSRRKPSPRTSASRSSRSGRSTDQLYALLFKAANKSTYWYNVQAFEDAGVEATEDWDEFLTNAETVKASGLPAYSIGGAEGWTLTDLFENIYLRTAGADMYDQLSTPRDPLDRPVRQGRSDRDGQDRRGP